MPFAAGVVSSAGSNEANICAVAAMLAATDAVFKKPRRSIIPSRNNFDARQLLDSDASSFYRRRRSSLHPQFFL